MKTFECACGPHIDADADDDLLAVTQRYRPRANPVRYVAVTYSTVVALNSTIVPQTVT